MASRSTRSRLTSTTRASGSARIRRSRIRSVHVLPNRFGATRTTGIPAAAKHSVARAPRAARVAARCRRHGGGAAPRRRRARRSRIGSAAASKSLRRRRRRSRTEHASLANRSAIRPQLGGRNQPSAPSDPCRCVHTIWRAFPGGACHSQRERNVAGPSRSARIPMSPPSPEPPVRRGPRVPRNLAPPLRTAVPWRARSAAKGHVR